MTIEELESYLAKRVELKKITEALDECEVVTAVQSASDFPYALHTVTQSGYPPDEDVTYLRERKYELKHDIEAVKAFVRAIPNEKHKSMINVKYIEGRREPSWLEIAFEFGYHEESAPRKAIQRYIQKSD